MFPYGFRGVDSAILLVSHDRISRILRGLQAIVPVLVVLDNSQTFAARLLSALSMLEAAAVLLYKPFADKGEPYRAATVQAASSILQPGNVDVIHLEYINPIMGVSETYLPL